MPGAYDIHLKLDDVKGESKHKDHPDEVQIESFHLGGDQQGTASFGGGEGAGKAKIHDAQLTAKVDQSTAFLFHAMASGKHYKEGTLTCRKAGGKQEKFLVITFSEVMVSSCQVAAHAGSDGLPAVSFALNFAKLSIEYLKQDQTGKTTSAGKKSVNIREMSFE